MDVGREGVVVVGVWGLGVVWWGVVRVVGGRESDEVWLSGVVWVGVGMVVESVEVVVGGVNVRFEVGIWALSCVGGEGDMGVEVESVRMRGWIDVGMEVGGFWWVVGDGVGVWGKVVVGIVGGGFEK